MLVNLLNEADKKEVIDYCHRRYALEPHVWRDKHLVKTKDALWVINSEMLDFAQSSKVEFESLGLRCFSGGEFPYKITDGFYKLFQNKIKKGRLLIQDEGWVRSLLKGESLTHKEWAEDPFDGYVLLFYGQLFFGIGLKKGDHLTSQIPKSFRSQLGKNLEIRNE